MNMNALNDVFGIIGQNENLRKKFLELCRQTEKELARIDFNVRQEVTAPIIDALHANLGILMKKIKPNIDFYFLYRSQIARELVMSPEEMPDHVWEPQTTRLLMYFSKNAKNVAIGGAYAGDQAILVAKILKDKNGVCHCFEPDKEQLKMLKYNAEKNSLDNLVFNDLGLWETDNADIIMVGEDALGRSEVSKEGKSDETFSTVTLSSYGKKKGIPHFDVIMLDIEGAELSALKGAEFYLKQSAEHAPKIVFELHRNYVNWDDGLDNTDIVKYLKDLGYNVFALRDYQGHVPMAEYAIELIKLSETYLKGPAHGFNLVAVKDVNVLKTDLFKMCSGVSPKLLLHRNPALHAPIHKLAKSK